MIDYFIAVISIVITISFASFLLAGNNILTQYKFSEAEKQSIASQLSDNIKHDLNVGTLVTWEEVSYYKKLYGNKVTIKNGNFTMFSPTTGYYYKVTEFNEDKITFLRDKKVEV